MRQIEIEWVGIERKVTADLIETKNPNLCNLLWESLPYNSVQSHALVSGDHLYHVVPSWQLVWEQAMFKEDRTQSPDGTVFLSQLQHLAVKYGRLSEYIPAAPVGRVIDEHIPILKQAGQEIWEAAYHTKRIIEVRVTRKGDSPRAFPLPTPPRCESAAVDELVREIVEETRRIWIDPPQELLDIHAGRITSGAGSRGQYFTTMLFVNGEQRPFGYGAIGGLVRSCFNTDLSLDALKQIAGNFIKVPAEFLGYCGLDKQWDFTQRTVAILKEVRSKSDFVNLMSALGTYANCLNGWNLHYFPWSHGDAYRVGDAPAPMVPPPSLAAKRVAPPTA
jgi:hypothetical protein